MPAHPNADLPMANREPPGRQGRRDFFEKTGAVAMAGGLVASYGTLGAMAGRFLYPAGDESGEWMFLTDIESMKPGGSFVYRAPSGHRIAVARVGATGDSGDFLALSSTCPHLGCRVHWEPQNNRFFCPCHNGTFDPSGKATAGPPAAAGQSLPRYPVKVEKGLLYIQVPAAVASEEPMDRREGEDPCLDRGSGQGAC